jgi:hypothetical protein
MMTPLLADPYPTHLFMALDLTGKTLGYFASRPKRLQRGWGWSIAGQCPVPIEREA